MSRVSNRIAAPAAATNGAAAAVTFAQPAARYIPAQNREWLENDEGQVVLLIPKFGAHRLGRWLMSRMKEPNYRVKLDEVGSFVWRRCDGANTVDEIGKQLAEQFGDKVAPVRERLDIFFKQLSRGESLKWQENRER